MRGQWVTTDSTSATANVASAVVVWLGSVPFAPTFDVHETAQVIVYVAVTSPFGLWIDECGYR